MRKIDAKVRRSIREKNARFEKMTKPQQRVAIAKDVIAALSGKGPVTLKAQSGVYVTPKNRHYAPFKAWEATQDAWFKAWIASADAWPVPSGLEQLDPNGQVQDELLQAGTCEVCAKGAIFVATVMRHDKLLNNEVGNIASDGPGAWWRADGYSMFNGYMDKFFSREQWDLIEDVFEMRRETYKLEAIASDKKRMIAIMQNIIDNHGTFQPVRLDE